MKSLKYILYSLIIAAAAGLLLYQGLVLKDLDSRTITRCSLIITAAVLGMLRPQRRSSIGNKKVTYQNAYSEHIQNVFSDDPKLENRFYNAVHNFNLNRPSAAINQLERMRPQCQRSADLRAVTVFLAFCYDDMGHYEKATEHYAAALRIRPNATLYSNMGLCYNRMGQLDLALENYKQAILMDPNNAFAHYNLASYYFQQCDYAEALRCARDTLTANANMPPGHGLRCCLLCLAG